MWYAYSPTLFILVRSCEISSVKSVAYFPVSYSFLPCIFVLPGLINTLETITRHKMYFIYLFSTDCFALRVVFHLTAFAYRLTFMHCYFHLHVCQRSDIYVFVTKIPQKKCSWAQFFRTFAIDILVIVYDKKWENRVTLSHHDQLALDSWAQCCLQLVNLEHPRSTTQLNVQCYLIIN